MKPLLSKEIPDCDYCPGFSCVQDGERILIRDESNLEEIAIMRDTMIADCRKLFHEIYQKPEDNQNEK